MKVRFDEQTDALYIRLDDAAVRELDFDSRNRVVGIEILGVRQRLPDAQLKQIQFEVA